MGVSSIVLGILGICICWLPHFGWLGIAMGVAACFSGVPSITHWFERSGYTGWGIAGIALGSVTISIGFAYQIKHAGGALDLIFHPLPTPTAYYVLCASAALIALGLILARLKSRAIGVLITALAIAVFTISGGWALTTADRNLTRSEVTAQLQPTP